MEDRIAISRLKQGDLTGLEALVNRYQAPAVHAAYLIVFDRALAEDVVHMGLDGALRDEQRVGDLLDDDDRPVGGRDEGTAFQRVFENVTQ